MRGRLDANIIVFDFDGTIVNLETNWDHLREELRSFSHERLGLDETFRPLDRGLERLKRIDISAFEYAIDIVVHYEIDGYKGRINKDVVFFIKEDLSPQQKLAIFSGNSRKSIETVLAQLGIYPDFIVGREDILENPKPSGKGLLKIVSHFNAEVNEAVFIGDSNLDLDAGSSVGIKTVLWRSIWI